MSEEPHPPEHRPVVLLVDDERSMLDAFRMQLGTVFDLETANSASEAELMMASRKYDVVVCDHLMPGEPGLDFLSRMSAVFPGTRRILVTGYMNPELISRSVTLADLSECLLKPLKSEAIIEAVKKALKG
jgi:DNA-binding NtrC family response regulator